MKKSIFENTVYLVFHFYRCNTTEIFQFAGFQGAYSNKEKALRSLDAFSITEETESSYISEDGLHRWEIHEDMIR